MKCVVILCMCYLLSSCKVAGFKREIVGGEGQVKSNVRSVGLEKGVIVQTYSKEESVRQAATELLAWGNGARALERLQHLVYDESSSVRAAALDAVRLLAIQQVGLEAMAEEILVGVVRSSERASDREKAISGLARFTTLSPVAVSELSDWLKVGSPRERVFSLWALAGREGLACNELENYADGQLDQYGLDWLIVSILRDCGMGNEKFLNYYASNGSPPTRFAASAIVQGNSGGGSLVREWEEECQARSMNDAAFREALNCDWEAVETEVLMGELENSRLVLFGEMHVSGGVLRGAQKQVLRHLALRTEGLAVGVEPSVRDTQKSVEDLALQLGLPVYPTERRWEDLIAQGRIAARDLQTAEMINEYLGVDDKRSMFVMRGESHILPGGYLHSKLDYEPIFIFAVKDVPLHMRGGRVSSKGRIFRDKENSSVFLWPCFTKQGSRFSALQRALDADTADSGNR